MAIVIIINYQVLKYDLFQNPRCQQPPICGKWTKFPHH